MSGAADLHLARRASGFLLDLYALSRDLPVDRFQKAALARLRSELPFRSAWWGTARGRPGGDLRLHNSFFDALPDEFAAHWDAAKHDDTLAVLVTATPGVAASMAATELHRMTELRSMVERFGIGSAMAIAEFDARLNLFTFLSLYRAPGDAPFDADDRCLHELVMPHLTAAWRANWQQHFARVRADANGVCGGLAVADQFGLLRATDASFADLLRSEWPQWKGAALPAPLHESIARDRLYCGRRLSVELWRERDLTVLRARPRSRFDQLSPREAEIADCYREGLSYKEIAARLACSPYTIRHHLRAIYDKLGVSNKAELAGLAGEASSGRRLPAQPR
jgi:DNA-binding CsgD family transcriptional regulator